MIEARLSGEMVQLVLTQETFSVLLRAHEVMMKASAVPGEAPLSMDAFLRLAAEEILTQLEVAQILESPNGL